MGIPARAYESRPVQVQYLLTSVLVEYLPAHVEKRRAEKALERATLASARGDREHMIVASIDFLAEVLTGWQHRDRNGQPTKPTREALGHMPDGWLGAACTAVGEDMQEFSKELNS